MNQQDHAIALGFGVADWGDNPTGYSVAYIPAWGKLKLTREYTFLDQASVALIPGPVVPTQSRVRGPTDGARPRPTTSRRLAACGRLTYLPNLRKSDTIKSTGPVDNDARAQATALAFC